MLRFIFSLAILLFAGHCPAERGMDLDPHMTCQSAGRDDRPRGLLVEDHRDGLIPGHKEAHVGTDFFEQGEFDRIVEEAAERAREIVASMRSGRIDRESVAQGVGRLIKGWDLGDIVGMNVVDGFHAQIGQR